ncbi:MAG: hypothetical protein LC749_08245 [Actinobacteria bacterium]|nr:hypothetical protein [Actinomycetota bacterium]
MWDERHSAFDRDQSKDPTVVRLAVRVATTDGPELEHPRLKGAVPTPDTLNIAVDTGRRLRHRSRRR